MRVAPHYVAPVAVRLATSLKAALLPATAVVETTQPRTALSLVFTLPSHVATDLMSPPQRRRPLVLPPRYRMPRPSPRPLQTRSLHLNLNRRGQTPWPSPRPLRSWSPSWSLSRRYLLHSGADRVLPWPLHLFLHQWSPHSFLPLLQRLRRRCPKTLMLCPGISCLALMRLALPVPFPRASVLLFSTEVVSLAPFVTLMLMAESLFLVFFSALSAIVLLVYMRQPLLLCAPCSLMLSARAVSGPTLSFSAEILIVSVTPSAMFVALARGGRLGMHVS